ncbi:MAG: hypothetical protein DHS20C15_05110 [Planctomycetota bacterium]|nr:MAG: hypothetical protein DHS20C15_05110 [Planctomycetota bacterium]
MSSSSDDSEHETLLDELVLSCLDALELRGRVAIDEACAAHPTLADALRARLAALADAGLLNSPDEHPQRLGEFRITQRLGGGGMGVVYAAVQDAMKREVALKVVRADQLYFPGARERFRREVQLVARLAHAGIVPVYTVGEDDGVPYFAMERLRGATLAEALSQLDRPPRDGSELADAVARVVEAREGRRPEVSGEIYTGSGLTSVLRLAQRVANALAHAHSRGVLHRDVKPSNVMLTTDGRALLFDFGLASAAETSRITQSGSRVGSLAYMSPEQAAGGAVDERSDVYGLGALLCEAATLRPPHEGTPEQVSSALLRGEPPAVLRRVKLPPDLVTLIETALAHDPAHRYQSADALARDLGNLLETRPIEARAAGPFLRTLRWTQRHPARAAALALTVALPLALAVQQAVANRRVNSLLDDVRVQRELAEANLEDALSAIDVFVLQLARDSFTSTSPPDSALARALELARTSLVRLVAQYPDNGRVRGRWLRVVSAQAHLLEAAGDLAGAKALFREALDGVRESDVPQIEWTPALNGLGAMHSAAGEWDLAVDIFTRCVDALAAADTTDLLCDLSTAESNLAHALWNRGDFEDASAAADRAVHAAERALELAHTPEERVQARLLLGSAFAQRARVGSDRVAISLALGHEGSPENEANERATDLLLDLLAEFPQRGDVVFASADVLASAANFLSPAQAEPRLRQAFELVNDLRRAHPGRLDTEHLAIRIAAGLGSCLVAQGRVADSRSWFEDAVALAEQVVARAPQDTRQRRLLGTVLSNLASAYIDLELRAQAIEPAARAGQLFRELIEGAHSVSGADLEMLAWSQLHEGYGQLVVGARRRVLELCASMPEAALADNATLTVAVGELHAGAAELSDTSREAAEQHTLALDFLERGIGRGFRMAAYLRHAREWDAVRQLPRFAELLARMEGESP